MAKQTINLGTTPTGVGGDTPRSAFTKTQANFDEIYTALGGTTIPAALPVAKGGTGGTTQATARTGLGLKSAALADILGVVSQSGGTPTGAICEASTNANGWYFKFANGLIICTQTAITPSLANAYNWVFNWTYPAPMSVVLYGGLNVIGPLGAQKKINTASLYSRTNLNATCSILSDAGNFAAADLSTNGLLFDVFAVGRWY